MTKNLTFNATIEVKETTKFSNQPLTIPALFVVTVPAKYKIPESTTNQVYIILGTAVLLLLVVLVVLVWKLKAKQKTDSGNFLIFWCNNYKYTLWLYLLKYFYYFL